MASESDLLYSMCRRDVENLIENVFGIDVVSNPFAKAGFQRLLNRYDTEIRGFLGIMTESEDSIDEATDMAKEEFCNKIDSFSSKLKTRLQDKQKKDKKKCII